MSVDRCLKSDYIGGSIVNDVGEQVSFQDHQLVYRGKFCFVLKRCQTTPRFKKVLS